MHPFHVLGIQLLSVMDCARWVDFVLWLLDATENDPQLLVTILFTDEVTFTREGVVNMHSTHTWPRTNPDIAFASNEQQRFKENICAEVLGNYLIGPYSLPEFLNGNIYPAFLRNIRSEMLQHLPAILLQKKSFMHDGAPAHFSIPVRNHLNSTYPGC